MLHRVVPPFPRPPPHSQPLLAQLPVTLHPQSVAPPPRPPEAGGVCVAVRLGPPPLHTWPALADRTLANTVLGLCDNGKLVLCWRRAQLLCWLVSCDWTLWASLLTVPGAWPVSCAVTFGWDQYRCFS